MYAVPLWVLLSSNVVIAAGTVYGGWCYIELNNHFSVLISMLY
jgi:hypothetical protein